MSVLGLIAASQVIAVFLRYADVAAQMVKERATAEPTTQTTPDPSATPYRPTAQTGPAATATGQQIQQLLEEAGRSYRLGDFEASLKTLEQLETIAPDDPKLLAVKAAVLQKLDQPEEAVVLLERLLKTPGLPNNSRLEIKKQIDSLAETIGSAPAAPKSGGVTTKALPEDGGRGLTDGNGIRAGATLGIIDIRGKELKRGKKTLSVSVKSLPNADIAGDKVKILAYFYEKTEDGEEVLTDSRIDNQWMSPPIDWAENEPEILDLEYSTPELSGEPGRKYLGYVVGLYYNGELQDFRSEPASLGRHHPLPFEDPQ